MLETLITSKTRLKLLMRLFLNPESKGYLQGLASEFGESSNSIRVELNRFDKAGLIVSEQEGRKKMYRANRRHPMFDDVQRIIRKYVGIDQMVDHIAARMGNLDRIYIEGNIALGIQSQTIEVLLIGEEIDKEYTNQLIAKCERLIEKRISYLFIDVKDAETYLSRKDPNAILLVWNRIIN
ncbi:MAG: ArsR family transcriptional regulator [Flavobacteriia bacterium]|nr:ArsR family transcriptional regulator [Flavobacteriia bacterium]